MATTDLPKASMAFVVDQTRHCIQLERRLAATPAQVFKAWTLPEEVTCWWDPTGQPLVICEIDLRPGGTFKFVARAHPEMPFTGIYGEIVPPERLTFETMGAKGELRISQDGDGARLSVEIQCRSSEHLRQFLQAGIDEGTSRTLDNLVAYIDTGVLR
jgi:uncharacterized protein YndB with AHSA1/START domain